MLQRGNAENFAAAAARAGVLVAPASQPPFRSFPHFSEATHAQTNGPPCYGSVISAVDTLRRMAGTSSTLASLILFGAGTWLPWTLTGNSGMWRLDDESVPITLLLVAQIISCFFMTVLQYLVLILPPCIKAKREDGTEESPNKTRGKRLSTAVAALSALALYGQYLAQLSSFVDVGTRNTTTTSKVGKIMLSQLLSFGGTVYFGFVRGTMLAFEEKRRQKKCI